MVVLINVPAPQEGVLHTEENTAVKCRHTNLGNGTFYITERSIYWINREGKGFSIPYESISAFAVSRKQSEEFADDCLFIITSGTEEEEEDEEEVADDNDDMLMRDFQVIPSNIDSLKLLYQIMMDAQKNVPAEDDDDIIQENSGEDDDENYEDAENEQNGFHGVITYVDTLGGGDNADISSDPEEDMNGNGEEEVMDIEQFEDASPEH